MNNQKRSISNKTTSRLSGKPAFPTKSTSLGSNGSNKSNLETKRYKCDVSAYTKLQGEFSNFKKESEKVAFDVTQNERRLVQKVSGLESLLESEQNRLKEFQELAASDQSENEAKISLLAEELKRKDSEMQLRCIELEDHVAKISKLGAQLDITKRAESILQNLLTLAIERFQSSEYAHLEEKFYRMFFEKKSEILIQNNICFRDEVSAYLEGNQKLQTSIRSLQEKEIIQRETIEMLKNSVKDAKSLLGTTQGSLTHASERESAKDLLILEGERARRKLLVQIEEIKGNIRVYCRVRPMLNRGNQAQISLPDKVDHRAIEVHQRKNNATSTTLVDKPIAFKFDYVFGPDTHQKKIFENIETLVESAVDGYRVCILAYGQTGSGKTHTMEGTYEEPGVIPRSFDKIFQAVTQLTQNFQWKFSLTCTYIEIYNDIIRDLLVDSEEYRKAVIDLSEIKHEIRHDGKFDTNVMGVKAVAINNLHDLDAILKTAKKNRTTARTKLNERSSRSHSVFTVKIEGQNNKLNQATHGVLCLIDLAGSERVTESGSLGMQFKEAVNINRSLSHLGDVIAALGVREKSSDAGVDSTHIPFRNCKLTYLLQNFLGGEGSKVLLLVNISPSEEHVQETISSLRFAAKVNSTAIGVAKKRLNLTS